MFEEILSPLFSTEWGRRSSIGALVLTTCLLFYVIFDVCLKGYHQFTLLHYHENAPTEIHINLTELMTQIPQWHLFGGGLTETLPLTSLQIHLTGIITDGSGKSSRAIISEEGRRGKVYQAGDVLESGVHIYAVTAEGVVLENGGQLEKLPLRIHQQENKSSSEASPNTESNSRED
jgi:hypothetical protein